MPEGCWIGVDPGSKYVGVAVGDAASNVASPLKVLDARPEGALLAGLRRVARDHAAAGFVVGLPLNMDGSESPGCKTARTFAEKLGTASKLPVELVDERLTSFEAEGMLIDAGLKPSERKMRVHAVSAALLLTAFFKA